MTDATVAASPAAPDPAKPPGIAKPVTEIELCRHFRRNFEGAATRCDHAVGKAMFLSAARVYAVAAADPAFRQKLVDIGAL